MTLNGDAAFGGGWSRVGEEGVLLSNVPLLGLATLPAVSPVANQEAEAVRIDLHARLEADAEVLEIHLVLVGVSKEKREMAGDGKE